jgi:hypothetical protein
MAADMEIIRPGEEVQLTPIANMDAATRSEINMQVQFAMEHPRKISTVLKEIEELVTLNQEIAEESFYTLKRKNQDGTVKLIQGPSIRFAEVLCYCWGHVRWQKQISNLDTEFVEGEGVFMDLQRNVVGRVKTKRRITDKNGRRYGADMIQVTGNAASSLAYRNAVTGSIPQALWKGILEKAKVVAVGGTASIGEKRVKALEYGAKIGVSQEQIFETLGIQGINDIGVDELIALKGLFNSLKDGETTIEEAFGDPYEKEIEELFDKLGKNQGSRSVIRGNYKGKSVALIAHLRDLAKPLGETAKTDTKPDAKPEAAKESTPTVAEVVESEEAKHDKNQQQVEVKRGRGRPPKDKTAEPVATPEEVKPDAELEQDAKAEEKPVEVKEKVAEKKPEPDAGSFNF